MIRLTLFFLAIILGPSECLAQVVFEMSGKIYIKKDLPKDCDRVTIGYACSEKPFADFHVTVDLDGKLIHAKSIFKDADQIQVEEDSWREGVAVKKDISRSYLLNSTTTTEIKEGKVFYTTEFTNGKVTKDTESANDNLVVPTTLIAYLKPHYSEIDAGKKIQVKLISPERHTSYTFRFSKEPDQKDAAGNPLLVLKMKATSFFVATQVEPMFFYVNRKTNELEGFDGRSPLRRPKGGKKGQELEELDAKIAYTLIKSSPGETPNDNAAKPLSH